MIPLWKILGVIDDIEDLARRACFMNRLAPITVESKPLPETKLVVLPTTEDTAVTN